MKETLNAFAASGSPWYRTDLPIVIMEQTKDALNLDDCKKYWGGDYNPAGCDDGYQKNLFKQEFYFSDGSCLKRNKQADGNVYFHTSGSGEC